MQDVEENDITEGVIIALILICIVLWSISEEIKSIFSNERGANQDCIDAI